MGRLSFVNIFSSRATRPEFRSAHSEFIVMMIVNFMNFEAGDFVLRCGHITHIKEKHYYLFSPTLKHGSHKVYI